MKFINQRDYPHWLYPTRVDMEGEAKETGKVTTVASSACGICCAVMVAHRLIPDCDFDLSQGLDLAYEAKANHNVGTDYRRYVPAFAEKMNLHYRFSDAMEDVLRCVRTGGAAIALVGGDRDGQVGLFTHKAHYIVVLNEEPDGRMAILDPSLFDGKFEEEGRQGKVEMKCGKLVLCSKEILDEEAKAQQKGTPYYLFWRN